VQARTARARRTSGSSRPVTTTPSEPVYQSSPTATAASDRSSSAGGRAGPSGPVSLLGAGTSPSG
jgi:hypothetical protein